MGPSPGADVRDRELQMLAQCRPGVFLAGQPAMLELRHDEVNKILVSSGNVRRSKHESVACAFGPPSLELISLPCGSRTVRISSFSVSSPPGLAGFQLIANVTVAFTWS